MRIANQYNHLNAREYLIVNKPAQYTEITDAIAGVDANHYLKASADKTKLGNVFYDQSKINTAIKDLLNANGWDDKKIFYYVTNNELAIRETIDIFDKEDQKNELIRRGLPYYLTFNQVDFQKDRVAVEVQFGKYFSVAYDLHVKHTFFYSRNDIDVGIEIIPTKAMEDHMDTGVPWFENEVTNVIREGRTNPPVPILIIGIEPTDIVDSDPLTYGDADYTNILRMSDCDKLKEKIRILRAGGRLNQNMQDRIEKIERCIALL